MDGILTLLTLGIIRFVTVKEGEAAIITCFGRYKKTLGPGLRGFFSLWGIFGRIHSFEWFSVTANRVITTNRVDMREIVFDYQKEQLISKDNVQFKVDAVIYFRITDPYKSVFKISDCLGSMHKLVQSILRSEMGTHNLEEAYSNRNALSAALTREADAATDDWGIKVIRLEIKEFDMGDFAEQMLAQKQQEISKRKQILEAEGLREAQLHAAEADKQTAITKAEGLKAAAELEADATRARAKADADAMMVNFNIQRQIYLQLAQIVKDSPSVLELLKLERAENIASKIANSQSSKVYLPNNISDLVAAFSTLTEMRN